MYCGHCAPCPKGIDIATVTKFFRLAKAQGEVPETVREHYAALSAHAGEKDIRTVKGTENMSCHFPEIKKNFGFGCMRLRMREEQVDQAEFCRMIDAFMAAGFNYFDTAHGYLSTKSEPALHDCLVKRYPRESFILADKLSSWCFKTEEDIRPFFEKQLAILGVDYLDFYLMHAQDAGNFEHYRSCRAYKIAAELREEGKIRHLGISFHDSAAVLDHILTTYPQIEVVQLQFNYADYDDPKVESRKCYDVCCKHGKPVIVMEPIKGGRLVKLPDAACQVFDALQDGSYASYALRFAAGFENVCLVLSGMNNMEQMADNLSVMSDFKPLNDREREAVQRVRAILHAQDQVPCTACRYCTDGCPEKIAIPDLFSRFNAKKQQENQDVAEEKELQGVKASACVGCGQCEQACPQHLPIRELLRQVATALEG